MSKMIKVTTPQGKVHVMPEAVNRNYYEKLNKGRAEKDKCKIEEATEEDATNLKPEAKPTKDESQYDYSNFYYCRYIYTQMSLL